MKRFALLIVTGVAMLSLLIPATSNAKLRPVCVERNFPGGIHLQIGYCP